MFCTGNTTNNVVSKTIKYIGDILRYKIIYSRYDADINTDMLKPNLYESGRHPDNEPDVIFCM